MTPHNKVPSGHLAQILELWKGGLTEKKAAAVLGYSQTVCSRAIREAGLHGRPNRSGKRYHFDEGYFSKVTNPEQAHILGLLATDGCVIGNVVQLSLHRRDREHLAKVNRAIHSDVRIRDYEQTSREGKVTPYCVLHYHSREMAGDLARLGIGPRKTWTVRPCFPPDHPLAPPWWQGCIDGDGSIYTGKGGRAWCIGYCGNRHMVAGFVRFVRFRLGFGPSEVRKVRRARVVVYAAFKRTQPLARLLYEGATLWLDRKKEKADALLSLVPRVYRWAHLTPGMIQEAYATAGEWNQTAQTLGMSARTLHGVRRRLGMTFEPRRPQR
jgi:hypothetical protein